MAILDELDLALVQAKTKRLRFAWRQSDSSYANFHDWDVFAEVRAKEARDADLLLSLTALFTVVDDTSGDGKYLRLTIPGTLTAGLDPGDFRNAHWDVFVVSKTDSTLDDLLVQGPCSFDPSTTDMVAAEA